MGADRHRQWPLLQEDHYWTRAMAGPRRLLGQRHYWTKTITRPGPVFHLGPLLNQEHRWSRTIIGSGPILDLDNSPFIWRASLNQEHHWIRTIIGSVPSSEQQTLHWIRAIIEPMSITRRGPFFSRAMTIIWSGLLLNQDHYSIEDYHWTLSYHRNSHIIGHQHTMIISRPRSVFFLFN